MLKTLSDITQTGKTIIVRCDFNVPAKDGVVTDDTRIQAVIPTLQELQEKADKIVLISHFGRPKGEPNEEFSLRFIIPTLSDALSCDVAFEDDFAKKPTAAVTLYENLRFHSGEENNDEAFAKKLAALGDIYVNDAFSVSHRAHASTEGITHFLPAYAGRLMEKEVNALESILDNPDRPVMAIVGGAKISTKLDLLNNLIEKVDRFVLGGGMANTFVGAQGHDLGKSLVEKDMYDTARSIMEKAKKIGCDIILPTDFVTAKKFEANAPTQIKRFDALNSDDIALDIGPQSVDALKASIHTTQSLLWNGPLGAFETPPFNKATDEIAQTVSELTILNQILSVAGGGDTIAALKNTGTQDNVTFASTAGGAFLEWLEGKELPGVKALRS